MITCPQCNWENPTYAAFCTNCGTGLGEKKKLTASGETWRFRGRENPDINDEDVEGASPVEEPQTAQIVESEASAEDSPAMTAPMGVGASLSGTDRRTLIDMTAPDFKAVAAQEPGGIDTEFGIGTTPLGSRASTQEHTELLASPDQPTANPDPPIAASVDSPSDSLEPEEAPAPAIQGLKATSSRSGQRLPISFADTMDLQGEAQFLETPKPAGLRDLGSLDVVLESMDGELDDASEEHSPDPVDAPASADKDILLSSVDLSIEDVASNIQNEAAIPVPPPPPMSTVSPDIGLRGLSVGSADIMKLDQNGCTIGRHGADLTVDGDQYLSDAHGRIGLDQDGPWVEDLDSLNGVWIRPSGSMTVTIGDEILLGSQIFRVMERDMRSDQHTSAEHTLPLGSRRARSLIRLAQIASDQTVMAEFDVPQRGCKIGRSIGDFLVADDETLSATHALIQPNEAGGLDIRDLSTGNGCWKRIRERRYLEVGDSILCGRSAWRVARFIRDAE